MKNKKTKVVLILIIVSILVCGTLLVYFLTDTFKKGNDEEETTPIALDVIKGYGYNLEDRDTSLYKEKFNELKEILNKEDIDYVEYANVLSELYIIDLYTINNKNTKYDIGSTEFVYPEARENFELKVKDTLYKYVIDNSSGKREQLLPEVKSTEVTSNTKESFKVNDITKDGYLITINWEYIEDLGYDKEAVIKIIKEDKKLYIIEQE